MSGYLTLGGLLLTPASAIQSGWVMGNTSVRERYALGAGLALVVATMAARIKCGLFRLFRFLSLFLSLSREIMGLFAVGIVVSLVADV